MNSVKEKPTKPSQDTVPTGSEPALPCVYMLSDHLLLSLTSGTNQRLPLLLFHNGDPEEPSSFEPQSSLGLPPLKHGGPRLLSVFALPHSPPKKAFLRLTRNQGASALRDCSDITLDQKTLLRQHLASLPRNERHQLLQWLLSFALEPRQRPDPAISEKLLLFRDALRERSPAVVVTPDKHRGMHVDSLFRIDERSYYIRGWVSVSPGPVSRLTAISPEGVRVELLERTFWQSRPDINELYKIAPEVGEDSKAGFLCYFELPVPNTLARGWVVEAADAAGQSFEAPAPEATTDAKQAMDHLIGDTTHERLPAHEFRSRHILPAVGRLQERHHRSLKLKYVLQFGEPPAAPEVSIIIPLYRRIDFLEHQLAQFVHDPAVRGADIIYMLDSPELAEPMREHAAALFELYRIPFRLAASKTNAGFAGVNNLGAGLAHGRLLLLLNSDVLPDRPGWLQRMIEFYDSKTNIGTLGVKLLFEDDTLQHAGLYFRQQPGTGLWENQHYFKGLNRTLPAANITRQVPAVSAACLMIDRALFNDLGGLRGIYVQGDYEDSDLCLRIRQLKREIWYLPAVELYHLEGQSYPSDARSRNLALNRWMHTWFWNQELNR